MGRPSAAAGITANVHREILPNGLTILVKENHVTPVAAVLVSVRTGYFDEPDRLAGISHVVEHMLFKGTPTRPESEQIAAEVREMGGMLNAATYYEETYYYMVAPSGQFARALEIQTDAVRNSLIPANELEKEIEVIVQESLQKRDRPASMLVETLYALAYDRHPLRRWRMGLPDALRSMTRDDLMQFVAERYTPDNITVTITGDVNTGEALEAVRRLWSDAAPSAFPPPEPVHEPDRIGFRAALEQGSTRQRLLLFAMPAPPALDPASAPLSVLNSILSDGRSSRLHQLLKERLRIASSAWSSYESFRDLGVLTLGAECLVDDPLPVERALWSAVTELRNAPPDTSEMERVKARMEARRLFSQEDALGVGRLLTLYQNLGDYRLIDKMVAQLNTVTPEEVCAAAATWFDLDRSSLLEYFPDTVSLPALTDPEARKASIIAGSAQEADRSAGMALAAPPEAIPLSGGGSLYYQSRTDLPVVAVQALFAAGRRSETMLTAGLTNLMTRTAIKGAGGLSAEEIANRIESLGTSIGCSAAQDYCGYGMKIPAASLEAGFAMLEEITLRPSFPGDEMEREKESIYADIRRQQDNGVSLAVDLFNRACYGEAPYGLPSCGSAEAVTEVRREDLVTWHAAVQTPGALRVAIVGAVTRETALRMAESLSLGLAELAGAPVSERISLHGPPATLGIDTPRKQTAAVIGFPGASAGSPDRHALDLLAEIASGMSGRLFRRVRGENALAYQVSAFHRARQDGGSFITYTSTAPENAEAARELILEECARLAAEPVTDAELSSAKASLRGNQLIASQSFSSQAAELAFAAVYGLPPEEPRLALAAIDRLTAEELMQAAQRYLQPSLHWTGEVRGAVE